jgi:hypothetical protein
MFGGSGKAKIVSFSPLVQVIVSFSPLVQVIVSFSVFFRS